MTLQFNVELDNQYCILKVSGAKCIFCDTEKKRCIWFQEDIPNNKGVIFFRTDSCKTAASQDKAMFLR